MSSVTRLSVDDFEFLFDIPWFSCVGNDSRISKSEAIDRVDSIEWENFQLDRSGDITEYLTLHNKDAYRQWNQITEELKLYLEVYIYPEVEEYLEAADFPKKLLTSIRWDVLSYLQEKTYEPYGVPLFFNLLIDSYKSGKLPCGWDGHFPEGALVEY